MYPRKESDKPEILGIVAVGTQADDVFDNRDRHEQRRKEAHKEREHQKLETFTKLEIYWAISDILLRAY